MDKVRIGVVGVGGMGYGHCKGVHETDETALTCVCDGVQALAESRGKEFGIPFFTDYNEMFASGLVDAVIVATPHWFHPDIAIAAFQKGLHVLSEKPIAVRVSDAERMIKAARKHKKVFAVMFQRRTEPVHRKALELIRSGAIGEIQRTLCVEPWYRAQAYYDSGTWRATWVGEGGGVLINQAPHGIDLFTMLGGMPSTVTAKTRTRLHKIEVEDEACAFLEYPNGAWGYYYATTNEPAGPTQMEFAGDKGKLVIRGSDMTLLTYTPSVPEFTFAAANMWGNLEVKTETVELPTDVQTGHREIIRNFAQAITTGVPVYCPGAEGLNSVEFINALILSGRTGRPVKVPVGRKKYDTFMEKLKAESKPKEHVAVQTATDPKFAK